MYTNTKNDLLMQNLDDWDFFIKDLFGGNAHFKSVTENVIKYPVMDQRYNDNEQQIIIAATGATKEDFSVTLKDDMLQVERTKWNVDKDDVDKYKYVMNGISRKAFKIAFKVPNMWDAEKLSMKLENGELTITIPIKEDSKPKNLEFNFD